MRNKVVGGVRIQELRLKASPSAPVTIKRYIYNTPGTTLSSGYLIGGEVPVYARRHTNRILGKTTCPDCVSGIQILIDIVHTTLSSNSNVELSGSDRIVGYTYVTVVDSAMGGHAAGKTVSRYLAASDDRGGWKPAVPTISNAWQRDQLVSQFVYATSPAEPDRLVRKLQHEYVTRDTLSIVGFNAGVDAVIQAGSYELASADDLFPYVWTNTRQQSGWQYLTRTRQYQYATTDTSHYQVTTTTYRYENPRHQQPTLVETLLAGGDRQQTRSRYAADYDTLHQVNGVGALAVRELLRTNQVGHLLEQTTWRVRGRDTLLTAGVLMLPRLLAPRVIVADQQLSWRGAAPLLRSQFKHSAMQGGGLRYDAGYEVDLVVDRYDARAKVAQIHTPQGISTSYLWDEVAAQPIVEGKALTLDQLAYTSFEAGAPGNWIYDRRGRVAGGVTGMWAYALAPDRDLGRSGLTPGQYQLSFWATAEPTVIVDQMPVPLPAPTARRGAWALYQLRMPVSQGIRLISPSSTTLSVDELRLYPVGAQVTTSTHQSLVGITSQTGPDNRTIFYEYDALGRLLRARDEQGRILSQQEYKYAKQP